MKLFVGGRYVSHNGFQVRVIEALHGDDIHWRDKFGPGKCSNATFKKWAGSMARDSPAPPLIVSPKKRTTPEVITKVKMEFDGMRKLSELAATFKIEPDESGQPSAAEICLVTINISLNMLKGAMEELSAKRPGARLAQIITRVDSDAALVESAISSLLQELNAVALTPLGERGRQLMESLADGSAQINRLRSYLGPCLGR